MKRVFIGSALVCMGLGAILGGLRADNASKEKTLRASLVGTWRLTSMKVNSKENNLPQTFITYKHVTPVGFIWLSHDKATGKVFRAAGGTYTVRDDTYTETVEYGMSSDFEVVKNAQHAFTAQVDTDTWHHTGKLANGTTIEEVWERVKPSEKD